MLKRLLSVALVLALPSLAWGQAIAPLHKTSTNTTAAPTAFLTAIALNASAANRTFTITNPGGGYAYANLEVARTRVAGSDLTMTCVSTTALSTTPTAQRTVCTYDATGICSSVTATKKSPTSVTETLAWQVNILGWRRTDCTVASTGAGGTDLITISGNMVTR